MQKIVPTDAVLIPPNADRVFKGVLFDTYQWQQEQFDGSHKTFEMIRRPDSVHVFAIVDGKLIVQYEQQPGRGNNVRTGFPGGRVDEGESYEDAAKRECLAETGYTFRNWKLINVSQPIRKMEWFVAAFVAWEVESEHAATPDAGEIIDRKMLSLSEARESLANEPALADANLILKRVDSLDSLVLLPEFIGKTIDCKA